MRAGQRGRAGVPWKLMRGDLELGELDLPAMDMPFWDGTFEPAPAFDAVRPLFEAELAAGGDLRTAEEVEAWERAWAAIDALGLSLDPGDGGEPVTEFVLHVFDNGTARMRY